MIIRTHVQLSESELRTLMNALTALDARYDVPADEFPFPRAALYARLRGALKDFPTVDPKQRARIERDYWDRHLKWLESLDKGEADA